MTATNIVDHELQRQLQSLACAKFKILKKHPPGRDVDPSDSFSFNNDFTSPMQRIRISTVASKVESGTERKETLGRVDEERRLQTEVRLPVFSLAFLLNNLSSIGVHRPHYERPETYDAY
jgi:cullin 3